MKTRSWLFSTAMLVCAAFAASACASPDQGSSTPEAAAVAPGVGQSKPACPTDCDDHNPCTVDTCDSAGKCHNHPVPDNTVCDDGNACTQGDLCLNGACVGSKAPDGTSCDDGNACTQTDACVNGSCVGGNPKVCSASDQCHSAGTCDPTSGQCSNPMKDDGTWCDDGDACTQTDGCVAGACVGANPVVCVATDQCHWAGACDHTNGQCSNPVKPDGDWCDDGNLCTQTDICVSGACMGVNPVVCVASNQCHWAGTCDPASGQCSNPMKDDGTWCDDGNLCTQTDGCVAGACVGANPVMCAASDDCHDVGACDPMSGQCSNPMKTDGSHCDDGDPCTTADACAAGKCKGGPAPDCSDNDACTLDTCDSSMGCVHTAIVCPSADAACSEACTDHANGCGMVICWDPTLGCSHGYWKTHLTGWCGCTPSDLVTGIFTAAAPYVSSADTLADALDYAGGSGASGAARILLRQAVASLLNAYDPVVSAGYSMKPPDVVDAVDTALAGGDPAAMLALAADLGEHNDAQEGGCPLN